MTTPANRFFDNPFQVPIGSSARSPSVRQTYEAVEYGFTLVQEEMDRLRFVRVFTDLRDVPRSYAGHAKKVVRVNPTVTGLEFARPGLIDIYPLSGAANDLLPEHTGGLLAINHSAETTLNVRPQSAQAFDVGAVIGVNQRGAGQVVIAPAAGVTIRSSDALLRTRTQHAEVALIYLGADEWLLTGERNAPSLAGGASTSVSNVWSGQQTSPWVDLAYASTMTPNANNGVNFRVALAGNCTIANPTNMQSGVVLNFRLRQDGAGGRTVTWGSMFKWPGGTAPVLSTGANATDLVAAVYEPGLNVMLCTFLKGFA